MAAPTPAIDEMSMTICRIVSQITSSGDKSFDLRYTAKPHTTKDIITTSSILVSAILLLYLQRVMVSFLNNCFSFLKLVIRRI